MKRTSIIRKDEIKLMADLLTEYSAKIMSLIDQWNSQRRRLNWLGLLFIFILFITLVGSIILNEIFALEYMIFYVGTLVIGILLIFLQIFRFENRKLGSIAESVYILESRLEKLIRKTSEIVEHVEKSKGTLLELDLKLAEAEGTLQAVKQVKLRNH